MCSKSGQLSNLSLLNNTSLAYEALKQWTLKCVTNLSKAAEWLAANRLHSRKSSHNTFLFYTDAGLETRIGCV